MKTSAGILLFRKEATIEVLLVHPGGPFWKNKDAGAWSIPKGEYGEGEDPLTVARREFMEETGSEVTGDFLPLIPVKQKGGKSIQAWACKGNMDASAIVSNMVEIEWPPRTGRKVQIPEVDRAAWFPLAEARTKINAGQAPLLDELEHLLA